MMTVEQLIQFRRFTWYMHADFELDGITFTELLWELASKSDSVQNKEFILAINAAVEEFIDEDEFRSLLCECEAHNCGTATPRAECAEFVSQCRAKGML